MSQLVLPLRLADHAVFASFLHDGNETLVATLAGVPDEPGVAYSILGPISSANIEVDMIVQNVSEDGTSTDMTFTVTRGDLDRAIEMLNARKDELGFTTLVPDADVVKVSVVGVGMRSHSGVAQKMFSALASDGVNIKVITTSEIKVSVLIDRKYMELAVQSLHAAFGLDAA